MRYDKTQRRKRQRLKKRRIVYLYVAGLFDGHNRRVDRKLRRSFREAFKLDNISTWAKEPPRDILAEMKKTMEELRSLKPILFPWTPSLPPIKLKNPCEEPHRVMVTECPLSREITKLIP